MKLIDKAKASSATPWVVGGALVALFAVLPFLNIMIPGVLPGPTYTPGTLQVLALCMLYSSLALSYHVIFSTAGLLSFGHALYFAVGAYGLGIVLQETEFELLPAIGLTIAAAIIIAGLIGAVSLRVTGISFAMVTLAFAQAGSVLVSRNSHITGGEEGLRLSIEHVPSFLIGVMNTRNLYWIALLLLIIVFLIVTWFERSRAGHVVVATRENELRVRVIGIRPFVVKHLAFVIGATLAAVVGMLYLLLQSGAAPRITTPDFTLTILVIVVLGGVGSRWGVVVGAIIYTILDQRLTTLSGSEIIQDLPAILRIPLSEPLFILGTLFILVVIFLPGGLAGVARRATVRSNPLREVEAQPDEVKQ
jgi:branched-chain amino acid transport system permease protein